MKYRLRNDVEGIGIAGDIVELESIDGIKNNSSLELVEIEEKIKPKRGAKNGSSIKG